MPVRSMHLMSTGSGHDRAPPGAAPGALRRLAVYGSLAPGRRNHHQVAGLSGRWTPATVRGRVIEHAWGTPYPGIVLDDGGPEVAVALFESADLPAAWTRLDAFEGPGYRRTTTTVRTARGALHASIYALAPTRPR